MEENEAGFRVKLEQFIEERGISDADVREDTDGECSTVAEYIEKLIEEYVEQ